MAIWHTYQHQIIFFFEVCLIRTICSVINVSQNFFSMTLLHYFSSFYELIHIGFSAVCLVFTPRTLYIIYLFHTRYRQGTQPWNKSCYFKVLFHSVLRKCITLVVTTGLAHNISRFLQQPSSVKAYPTRLEKLLKYQLGMCRARIVSPRAVKI